MEMNMIRLAAVERLEDGVPVVEVFLVTRYVWA
jgi:hypothetical protein